MKIRSYCLYGLLALVSTSSTLFGGLINIINSTDTKVWVRMYMQGDNVGTSLCPGYERFYIEPGKTMPHIIGSPTCHVAKIRVDDIAVKQMEPLAPIKVPVDDWNGSVAGDATFVIKSHKDNAKKPTNQHKFIIVQEQY